MTVRASMAGLNGETGLLTAILLIASQDLESKKSEHRESAREFFMSDWYLDILDTLDLDDSLLPVSLQNEEINAQHNTNNRISGD